MGWGNEKIVNGKIVGVYVCVWYVSSFEFELSVGCCSGGWSHSIVWLMMNAGIDDFLASKSYALVITYGCAFVERRMGY